jgi:hypothetical protein
VTLLVAGPGFGKTTVLAQTVRAHQAAPRGIDVWVSCEAAYEDPVCFATALLDAMSAGGRSRGSGRRAAPGPRDVVGALIRWAPLEVCLLLDDVHEIPAGSPGAAFLREVARTLPATAHLVLSGREAPDVPLARREATGEVIRITDEDLAFTDVEVRALARRLGRDERIAEPLHGWPAMVRLFLAAGAAAPWQYAREEVLCRVSDPQRLELAALAALGTGTAREVAEVTGGPVTLDDLARQVPLVGVLDDGRYRAHDLWADALPRIMTVQDEQFLLERAVAVLAGRGDLARAGRLAASRDLASSCRRSSSHRARRGPRESWLGDRHPSPTARVRIAAGRGCTLATLGIRASTRCSTAWRRMGRWPPRPRPCRDCAPRAPSGWPWSPNGETDGPPAATCRRRDTPKSRPGGRALARVRQGAGTRVPQAPSGSIHCLNMRMGRCGGTGRRTLAEAGDELVRLSGAICAGSTVTRPT